MGVPGADAAQVAGLQAQLRILERRIDATKADIHALTQLTQEETVMAVSERISTNMAASHGGGDQARHNAERQRVTSCDAEGEEVRAGRADERAADTAMAANDASPPASRPLTLGEKLEQRAAELREQKQRPNGLDDREGRTRSPGRG